MSNVYGFSPEDGKDDENRTVFHPLGTCPTYIIIVKDFLDVR